MRILFVTRRSWPAVGGVETYLRNLAGQLRREHQVTILAQRIDDLPSSPAREIVRAPPRFTAFSENGVDVVPLELSIAGRALALPLIAQITPLAGRFAYGRARVPMSELYGRALGPSIAEKATQADVVHSFSAEMVGSAALRGARLAHRPVVVTPFTHPGQWGDDPASQRVCRRADRVVGLLRSDAEIYRGFGVAERRLQVSPICVPPFASVDGASMRAQFGITGPVVLFLGRRAEYKGFDTLIEAAPRVGREVADLTIVFVGPGPPIKSPGSGYAVIDRGVVTEKEKGDWLAAADVLCLPSAAEIFPVSVMEAWSVGTPAVTSDIPPLRELAERSGGSLAVAPTPESIARALTSVLLDPELRERLGHAGHAFWNENGTPEAVARTHVALYEQVIRETSLP